jgi:hypothetical protein
MENGRLKSYALDSYKPKSQARHPKMRSWLSYIAGMEGRPVMDDPEVSGGKSDRLDRIIKALLKGGR